MYYIFAALLCGAFQGRVSGGFFVLGTDGDGRNKTESTQKKDVYIYVVRVGARVCLCMCVHVLAAVRKKLIFFFLGQGFLLICVLFP